ncbi:T9SS type A sorting domain-containing protein [Planktosalinus lacus]|uniref:Secretion system C-terminal sorting domain-containing protein n=1 Tax=Planktosalinus lacus TaxID=1526573 RepID=A0A8J2V6I6_9FLAO|nr:T9SS type A sorting domain-containing protein [Planktosalinus lacus]GGD81865.1 hypothetical protein GCM10011312_02770 [Planktosalinus lacus]
MKKTLLYFFLCCTFIVSAQVTNEGTPESWKLSNLKNLESIKMPKFDLQAMQAEDAIYDGQGDRPWRFGKEFIVNHTLENSGEWTTLDNGARIWRIRYQSEGAITMNFLFEDFYMPRGGKIFLYNNDKSDLLGAYDHSQNNSERTLGTWLVDGEDVWIEYYEPAKVQGQGILQIGKVVHGYRSQSNFAVEKGLNDSGDCNHDVDCPIGEFEDLKNHNKKGVVMLLSGSSGFCSASLINNTSNDGTPYVLTANHCYSNPATWAFRFNWISPDPVCASTQNSTNGPTTQTMSGATLRSRIGPSDFCLVEINNPIPGAWDVVWNGWDRSDDIPDKTWGIHHPSGDIMKVCVDDNAPGQLTQNGNEPVWRVFDWDLGVTEGGSSGSPLFDPQGKIVGQLWRGAAACAGTNDNNQWDEYGRFGRSWADGATPATRLEDWLDPDATGLVTIDANPPFEVLAYNAGISINNVETLLCDNVIEPVLVVRNLGSETLVSADIEYGLEGTSLTQIEWTGSLENGEQEEIILDAVAINQNGTFTATLENPNGQPDEFPGNNEANVSFEAPEEFITPEVNLTIVLDDYPEETTWEFLNSAGATLYSGGPYPGQDGQTIEETFTLSSDDCYTFTIIDDFGDGICCGFGNGSYSLETEDGTIIIEGGEFESSESVTFSNFNVLSTGENQLSTQVSLYPNPSTGMVTISNTTGNNLNYEVFNVVGQVITKGDNENNLFSLDLSNNAVGLYFVKLTDVETNSTTTKKLILK